MKGDDGNAEAIWPWINSIKLSISHDAVSIQKALKIF